MRPEMRSAVAKFERFIVTTTTSKHRLFVWLHHPVLPDHQLIVFASDSDYFFGLLHSRFHEVWALKLGTRLETRPRYTPTTCFEKFPFPHPTSAQEATIAAAAKELNELRERWLNPPEWTVEKVLEFPGSVNGPWARYVDPKTVDPKTGIGTVRYPRLEPRDAECAAKLKKRTLTNLYNERPAWLDLAHRIVSALVMAACLVLVWFLYSTLMQFRQIAGYLPVSTSAFGIMLIVCLSPGFIVLGSVWLACLKSEYAPVSMPRRHGADVCRWNCRRLRSCFFSLTSCSQAWDARRTLYAKL